MRILACCLTMMTFGFVMMACEAPAELVPQDIHLEDDFIDFGMVSTTEPLTIHTKVHNSGDVDLVFSIPPKLVDESSNQSFDLVADWEIIGPRSYEILEITYTPVAEQDSFGSILLYSNDPDEANRVIVLMGSSFTGLPQAYVTPSLVEYGFVASGNSAEGVVEIWNTGDVPMTVVDVTVGGSESLFEVLDKPVYPIPAGEKALATVAFNSEGGNHTVGSLTVEIADAVNPYYTVNLSANSPGSTNNSLPQIDILDPTQAKVFYMYQNLWIEARVFDAQQPNIGLYCTLESNHPDVGLVEQNTSHWETTTVEFDIEIDESDFELYPGLHTLTLCCTDVFVETACTTLVVSINEEFSEDDDDGDGYSGAQGDCVDTDDTIYPAAIELADGVDNNCDGIIDEHTVNYDDDNDGYCESDTSCTDGSLPGDCNDSVADLDNNGIADGYGIHPDAAELADFFDNDCDGTIDEETINYDDDVDGFTEALGDCDDADPEVYRDAPEYCDSKDNDCDGEVDEDCIDTTPPLILVGGLTADIVAVKKGESVELHLTVISGPDAELVFDWGCDGGEFTWYSEDQSQATWKAPDTIEESAVEFSVFCKVTDTNSAESADDYISKWAFLELTVMKTDPLQSVIQNKTTCSISSFDQDNGSIKSAVALTAALLLSLCIRRRR